MRGSYKFLLRAADTESAGSIRRRGRIFTATPHAIRIGGGALRVFWPTGGGKVVLASATKILGTAGTTATWVASVKVAAEVAVVAVVVGGTVYLVQRVRRA